MAPNSGPDDAPPFEWNRESQSASRLAALMHKRHVGVNALAKALTKGERKTVQRWLKGGTIIAESREKLGRYFGVDPSEFMPPDRLSGLRPLLEQVEAERRRQGLRIGTIVGELQRLAER